jgi:hypothetical protein
MHDARVAVWDVADLHGRLVDTRKEPGMML